MNSQMLASAQAVGQSGNEDTEGFEVGRDMCIGNRVRDEPHPKLVGQSTFFRNPEHCSFIDLEQRNQGFDAALFQPKQRALKAVAAQGAQDNRQIWFRLPFDPENLAHFYR